MLTLVNQGTESEGRREITYLRKSIKLTGGTTRSWKRRARGGPPSGEPLPYVSVHKRIVVSGDSAELFVVRKKKAKKGKGDVVVDMVEDIQAEAIIKPHQSL